MHSFFSKIGRNKIDTEIDEFGNLKAFEFSNRKIGIKYKRNKTWREIERAQYKTTGISQLGTTYPTPYDRESLIKKEYQPAHWYSHPLSTFFITVIAIVIDVFCYLSMFEYGKAPGKMENFYILISTIGAAIAIDVLPMFLSHNIHRIFIIEKKDSKKRVLILFSIISIILFISVIVLVFKIRLKGMSKTSNTYYKYILMSIIPISTSLLCFISGFLSFSNAKSKLLHLYTVKLFLEENINELEAMIAEVDSDTDYSSELIKEDNDQFESATEFIDAICEYYKSFVRENIVPALHSPADTSDLTSKR